MLRRSFDCTLAALALASSFSGPIFGEEGAPKADLTGLAGRLQGADLSYGIFVGSKNIGQFRLRSEAAENGGVEVTMQARLDFGPKKQTADAEVVMDSDLVLVSGTNREETDEKIEELECEATGDGKLAWKKATTKKPSDPALPASEPTREESTIDLSERPLPFHVLFLVVPALDWTEGSARSFTIFEDEKLGTATASFMGKASLDVFGRTVDAIQVEIVRFDKPDESNVLSIAAGRVVEIAFESNPLRMLLGSEEEIARDLPETENEETLTVRKTVMDFLRAVTLGDADAVEALADLGSFQERSARINPAVGAMDEAAYRKTFLDGVTRNAGKATPDEVDSQLGLLRSILAVEVEGDSATVAMPGQKDQAFQLERVEGVWRVVWWPPLAGKK